MIVPKRWQWIWLVLLLATCMSPSSAAAQCPGDCDGDGTVEIQELVRGVRILLGTLSVAECSALDTDFSDDVTIGELVVAVNKLINGCSGGLDIPATGANPGGTASVGLVFNGTDIDVYVIAFEVCFDPDAFGVDSAFDACEADASDVSVQVFGAPSRSDPCLSVLVTSNQGEHPLSDCCFDHIGAGCFHAGCEACVCDANDQCCDPGAGWTPECTDAAADLSMGLDSCGVNCLCRANGIITANPFSLFTCTLNILSTAEPGNYSTTTRTILKGENKKRFVSQPTTIPVF